MHTLHDTEVHAAVSLLSKGFVLNIVWYVVCDGDSPRIVQVHLRWDIHSDFAVIERMDCALLCMCSNAVSSAAICQV